MPLDAPTLDRFRKGNTFVETGAGPTLAIRAALGLGFERIVSIEIDDVIFERCRVRYQHEPRVEIVHGDCRDKLPEVLATVQEPCTIFLDAHGKSGDTSENLANKPLLDELAAIAAHPIKTHTILIDDWDMIASPKWCPHLTEESVRDALRAINPDYQLSRVDGLIHERKNPYWLVMVAQATKGRVG